MTTSLAPLVATAQGHHGELIQGQFPDGETGSCTHALVTLPCPLYRARAEFRPATAGGLRVAPAWAVKAQRAAQEFCRSRQVLLHGELRLSSSIPVAKGFGSSSADVVATLSALVAATATSATAQELAAIAVVAEGASDPLLHQTPVLFAQREGRVLRSFGQPLPELFVIGFDLDPERTVVTERQIVPSYTTHERAEFQEALRLLADGITSRDGATVARAATISSAVESRRRDDALLDRALEDHLSLGADGVQVAHSGTIAGFLFGADHERREAEARVGPWLRRHQRPHWTFRTGTSVADL